MDIRWLWTLGVISCLLLDVRGASSPDAWAYGVSQPAAAPGGGVVEVVPLATARRRRHLLGEELDGGGGVGGSGDDDQLSRNEVDASGYRATAAGPDAMAGNVSAVPPSPSPAAPTPTAAPAVTVHGGGSSSSSAAPVVAAAAAAGDMSATVTKMEAASADSANGVDRYPQTFTNQNISHTKADHQQYYNNRTVRDAALAHRLWTELTGREDVHINAILSRSHRRASRVQLSFDFPFYGHPVRNVSVATGGFVYLGDFIHSWLAATQYVAPLMADFDTSISDHSFVKYLDNGTAFTVRWENVHLKDRPEVGGFSFQLTLHDSGDIVFVYRDVPLPVEQISNDSHPVKVGISDAYLIDRKVFFVQRKTIYEYHRLSISLSDIQNGTVIVLTALPTCRSAKDCVTCLTGVPNFQCRWCEGTCSDAIDRQREELLKSSCDRQMLSDVEQCPRGGVEDDVRNFTEPAARSSQAVEAAQSELQRTDEEPRADDTLANAVSQPAGAAVEVVSLAASRRRRYLAGEETGAGELGGVGGGGVGGGGDGGPRYDNPLSGSEADAGRYKTTAASAPAGPAPTAANVTVAGNVSAVPPSPSAAAPTPTAATAVTGNGSSSSAAPTAALPTQTSTGAGAGAGVPAATGDMSATVTETEAATADEANNPDRYPQIFTNQTFKSHNISHTDEDHHLYYNSTTVTDAALAHQLWTELTGRKDVHVNAMLSQSHRRASTVQLSFDFPFYGHPVRNVTVATGGFVYMGDFIHSWLAATQFVAPLMANFDTSISDHSFVKYLDNGTAFTVQWENVHLQDRAEVGGFSFQLTLHSSGDIVFVYRDVPLPVEQIADYHHPVKVGISDAYIIDRNVYFVRRKTIYEYHRVAFSHDDIQNGTVIVLTALPTCRSAKDCVTCLTGVPNFQCRWCKSMCSDGMDRRRQEWLQSSCDKQALSDTEQCPPPAARDQHALPTLQPLSQPQAGGGGGAAADVRGVAEPAVRASQAVEVAHSEPQRTDAGLRVDRSPSSSSMSVSGVVAILSVVTLVCASGVWILYAYRNPHTASGQFLIRYRPSQWSWRRGEARYTAATIHM